MAAAALFCAAAFAPGLTAYAQNLDEGTYEEKNGIAYRKSATLVNGTTDEYWIELEAFVTGEVKVVTGYKPVDIAIVLDKSGSMVHGVDNTRTTTSIITHYCVKNERNADLENINVSDNYGYTYYYKDGDTFYQLKAESAQHEIGLNNHTKQTRYFVYYTKNGAKYYLGQDGFGTISKMTNSYTSGYYAGTTYWTDEAKQYSSTNASTNLNATAQLTFYRSQSRMEILKDAVKSFVQKVAYYDTHDSEGTTVASVGHQVAIVSFSNDVGTPHSFSGVSDAEVTEINNAIDGIQANGYTNTDLGVQKAVSLINALEGREDASKVIVVFTDGNPGGSDSFDTTIASNAIGAVHTFKASGKVYTIGMINNPSANAKNFLNYLSSNYPNAESMTSPGTVDSEGDYYQLATGSDLTSIFESIAEHAAGTAGNTQVTAESAVTVDVVTTSFNIPKTAGDTYDIQVLVAKCNGQSDRINPKTGKNYLTFAPPVSPEAAGFEITLDPDALDNNEVVTHGFDYSANFCAYNAEADPPARGYKQIIRFRIKANEDAVGGPDVTTNDQSSGIWIDDPDNPGQKKQIAEFNRPTVKVPVQIWIAKDGLVGDDNAIFTLYWAQPEERHYVPDPNNPERMVIDPTKFVKAEWHQFTKVTLNNNLQLKYTYNGKQIPLVKIPGLDPDYVYQIKEDAWSWSSEPVVRIMYTAGEEIHNPFVFVNQPRENLKEAESGIRNVFNEGTVTPDPNAPVAP